MLTGHSNSLQRKIKQQIGKLQDMFNLIDYHTTGVITADMLNITLLYFRQEVPCSELERWINRADKDKNGNLSLSEFVSELTIEPDDEVSSGIFAELDHDEILREHRDLSQQLRQTRDASNISRDESLPMQMFPLGHQLQLLAVGGTVPLEKFRDVCSLAPRKRTETELTQLALWLKHSTHLEIIKNMTTMQLQELMRGAALVTVSPGDYIIEAEQPANRIVMILDGHATLNREPNEEDPDALYLPWSSLRYEGMQVLSCFKALANCAEILRPPYALTGRGVQVLSDMSTPCQSAAHWFDRWMESLTSFKDDCQSVLHGDGVIKSLEMAVEMIETAWPTIEAACSTFQLMRVCEVLAKSYGSLFVDVQRATQSMLVTAATLHISFGHLKNILEICMKHQASRNKQRAKWEGVLTQLDIQAEQA